MEASHVTIEHNVVFNHVHFGGDGSGIKIGTHESYLKPSGGHIGRFNFVINSKLRNLDLAGNYRSTEKGLRPRRLSSTTIPCFKRVVTTYIWKWWMRSS